MVFVLEFVDSVLLNVVWSADNKTEISFSISLLILKLFPETNFKGSNCYFTIGNLSTSMSQQQNGIARCGFQFYVQFKTKTSDINFGSHQVAAGSLIPKGHNIELPQH